MPKNPPKNPNYPRIRSTPTDNGGGGGVAIDLSPNESLILVLENVDMGAASSLTPGDAVIVFLDATPIVVATVLGLPIGQVRQSDMQSVRLKNSRRGIVYLVEMNPLTCVVEVR